MTADGGARAALAELVERRTGLAVTDDKMEGSLLPHVARRVAALGLAAPAAYVGLLAGQLASGAEWAAVIRLVTNGQTSLFRDPEQFAAIERLLAARARPERPLWIWSVGCSTGEEAFSLAILCAELGLAGRARIVASDLNPEFLERAGEAHFSAWATRNVPPERRARWFEPDGDGLRARGELRRMIELRRHNLVGDEPLRPPEGGWHAILCRNLFIYFRRERVAESVRRLAGVLAPDGWLAVSASETLRGLGAPLEPELVGGRVFYRPGGAPPARTASGSMPAVSPPPPASGGEAGGELDAVVRLAQAGLVREAMDLLLAGGARTGRTLAHHLARGHLHLRLHEIDAALAAYRCAADIDALQCEVHFFEGVAHRKAGNWSQAADALRRALFLAPGLWQAAYLLAGAHERTGRTREAERERRRAADLLRERAPRVVFLSHPVFVDWFSVDEAVARRALGIAR